MSRFLYSIRRGTTIAVAVAGLVAAGSAFADRHGGERGRDFRDRHDARALRFDSRFHHDHYYPRRGTLYRALPPRFDVVLHHGIRFYFGDGIWLGAASPGRFAVVAPPIGAFIRVLPVFATTVWVGATPYYYANDVYYARSGTGYVVVAPPAVAATTAPHLSAPTLSAPPLRTASADDLILYPRDGQSRQQTESDRQQCSEWATGQTGYDPRFGLPDTDAMAGQKAGDYGRAIEACLDGRGYTVR